MFSKVRLAPKDPAKLTLPRLELLAMHIGAQMTKFVKQQLNLPISNCTLFSDSECVLKWLTTSKPLKVFVDNRVKSTKAAGNINFRYVPTTLNPADCASRGVTFEELREHQLWWHGPAFLKQPVASWCEWNIPEVTPELLQQIEAEQKAGKPAFETKSTVAQVVAAPESLNGIDVERFSNLNRLRRYASFVLRFINISVWNKLSEDMQKKHPHIQQLFTGTSVNGPLTATDLKKAQLLLERQAQERCCSGELAAIQKGEKHHLVQRLDLFLDETGLLRCKGRLVLAEIPESTKRPKLLKKDDHFTKLIFRRIHQKLNHIGENQLIDSVRSEYWVPQIRSAIRSFLSKCVLCKKNAGSPFKPPTMKPLPPERVKMARPIQFCGLDYFGPFTVKQGNEKRKMWCCLYTCMVTRLIHLELVFDLTAVEFLHCLRRFVARRGTPEKIVSDNFPSYKLAKTSLEQVWATVVKDDSVLSYGSSEGIMWNFITEAAPWQGGLYERLIGLVKQALGKAIGKKQLRLEEFSTLLCKAEAIVNSRPLTFMNADIHSPRALRPIDFVTPQASLGMPEPDDDPDDPEWLPKVDSSQKLINSLQNSQRIIQQFWQHWQQTYLTGLRERSQTEHPRVRNQQHRDPILGELVLIKDDNLKRGEWVMGKVINIFKSSDNQIRSVEVLLPNSFAERLFHQTNQSLIQPTLPKAPPR